MNTPDLNLLVALDVLLTEGNVARAAHRLQLSPSATSRALARLREVTGDPLLVRAGRGLVPTPRAVELRDRVGPLVQEAVAMLRPAEELDLSRLSRTFTLRTSDGFVENFGTALITRVERDAPGVRLRFMSKTDRESTLLRDGLVDLETGVVGQPTSPEIRVQALFRDHFVGVVRQDHPLSQRAVTAESYLAGRHIAISRRGSQQGPIDDPLAALGLERKIATVVAGFAAAIALVRNSDLIASVPEGHTRNLRKDLHSFALPFAEQTITVSMLWHPRMDADPAHRWLRNCMREVCRS